MGAMSAVKESRGQRLVVLVRHAKAESGEDKADHDRELTGRGHRAAAEAGRWLAAHVPAPDLVWCSSAARARQTWEGIAASVSAEQVHVERALYLASAGEVVERVRTSDARVMAVVGHNPTMEQVLATLTGELRGLRPGALAVVDPDRGELREMWEPARSA